MGKLTEFGVVTYPSKATFHGILHERKPSDSHSTIFYAGIVGDFTDTSLWKMLLITPHDHNPVHDAMGNVEAFVRILKGER